MDLELLWLLKRLSSLILLSAFPRSNFLSWFDGTEFSIIKWLRLFNLALEDDLVSNRLIRFFALSSEIKRNTL